MDLIDVHRRILQQQLHLGQAAFYRRKYQRWISLRIVVACGRVRNGGASGSSGRSAGCRRGLTVRQAVGGA